MSSKETVIKHHKNAREIYENKIFKIIVDGRELGSGTNSTIAWFNAKRNIKHTTMRIER